MMLVLTMMNDNDIASKFKATIRILFIFGRIIVLIICIRMNSKDPLFETALISRSLRQGQSHTSNNMYVCTVWAMNLEYMNDKLHTKHTDTHS